jgi:hypothetical protein
MAISTLDFVAIALSAWRLAFMLVNEAGPGNIFAKLRRLVGVRERLSDTPGGKAAPYGLNPLADAFCCIFCMSVWTAALSWLGLQTPIAPVVYILAASGLAILAHQYIGF